MQETGEQRKVSANASPETNTRYKFGERRAGRNVMKQIETLKTDSSTETKESEREEKKTIKIMATKAFQGNWKRRRNRKSQYRV